MFALPFAETRTPLRPIAIVGCMLALCAALTFLLSGSCSNAIAIPSLCGTKYVWLAAFAAASLPLTTFVFLQRPLAFTLCGYAALLPLDSLAGLGGSGVTLDRWLGLIAVGLLLVSALNDPQAVRPPRTVVAWFVFVAYAACSAFWAIDPRLAAHELPTLCSLAMFFALLASIPLREGDVRMLLNGTVFGGALGGCLALYLRHVEPHAFLQGRLYLSANTDPNQFAAALLLPLALAYVGAVHARRLVVRVALIAAAGLSLTGIYLTGSRGSFLAVAAMFAYLIVRDRRRILHCVIAAAAAFAILTTQNTVIARFSANANGTGAGRVSIWHVAFAAIRHNQLFGVGFANFPLAYDRSFFESFQSYFAGWNRAPHSLIVSTTTELGMVGLALVLVALALQWRSLRSVGVESRWFPTRLALEAGFIGIVVGSLFLDVMTRKPAWLAFAEMAIVAGVARRVCSEEREPLPVTQLRRATAHTLGN